MELWSNKSIARDLNNYTKVLKAHHVEYVFDVSRLSELADRLPDVDHCEIEEFEIEFYGRKPITRTVPKIGGFKISLINSLSSVPGASAAVSDPISTYSFDLVITGFCDVEEGKEFINCWHLDKDLDSEGEQKYTHPRYHFQFGGKRLIDVTNFGGLMLMGAPRIPHPPMDLFLAIHFILNNYFDKTGPDYSYLNGLFSDEDYQEILKRAKSRMWYPYFQALSNEENCNADLNLANLFPLAV